MSTGRIQARRRRPGATGPEHGIDGGRLRGRTGPGPGNHAPQSHAVDPAAAAMATGPRERLVARSATLSATMFPQVAVRQRLSWQDERNTPLSPPNSEREFDGHPPPLADERRTQTDASVQEHRCCRAGGNGSDRDLTRPLRLSERALSDGRAVPPLGRISSLEAPALTAEAAARAAIQIARPLGEDPKTDPIIDARLGAGSRAAVWTPG